MKTRNFVQGLAILWLVITSSFTPSTQALAFGTANNLVDSNQAGQEMILNATIKIKMSVTSGSQGEVVIEARGLGSLAWDGKEMLLITHNHWDEVLQDMAVVEFYDFRGRLCKLMFGSDFNSLVIYDDAGTLILKAPEELAKLIRAPKGRPLKEASLRDSRQVKVGETVLIIHHQPGKQEKIAALEAKVESIFKYQSIPAFKLRSLNGQPILKGDSGGGIWYNGQFIGNLWVTILIENQLSQSVSSSNSGGDNFLPTYISYGAIFPD